MAGLSSPHLPVLDGLRAVAAFLVVFYHCGIQSVPGGLGVLAFFVLSGFLITWLMLGEDEATGTVSLRQFYYRRMLRIFPPFYAYWILLTFAALMLGKSIVWPQSIASLLYVNNYYQAIFGDPNTGFSHTWSLAIEEQFYLLWPPLFLFLHTNRMRLAKALAIGIAIVWAHRLLLQFAFGVDQGYIYEAFDTRADHLMIGCLMAVLLRSGFVPTFWHATCGHVGRIGITAGLLGLSIVAGNTWGEGYRDAVGFIVDPVVIAILLAQLIAFRGSAAVRWLDWPVSRYLGRISYSTYLYQQVVVEPATQLLAWLPRALQVLGAAGAVIVVASISHFAVEKPFLKLKRKPPRKAAPRQVPRVSPVVGACPVIPAPQRLADTSPHD